MNKIFYIKSKIKNKTLKENKSSKEIKDQLKNSIPTISPVTHFYTVEINSHFPLDRALTKDELIQFYKQCPDHPIWVGKVSTSFCSVAILDKIAGRICAVWGLNGYYFIDNYGVEWEAYVYPFYDLNK